MVTVDAAAVVANECVYVNRYASCGACSYGACLQMAMAGAAVAVVVVVMIS
jgi:hypothetical protein